MRNIFSVILLILILVVTGCRASKESKTRSERTTATVAALELHRVDSLWSSLVERLKYKIEFYPYTPLPPSEGGSGLHTNIQESPEALGNPPRERTNPPCPPWEGGSPSPADPSAALLGLPTLLGGNGGGCGSVKSIEITASREAETQSLSLTDSTADCKFAETMESDTEKASEARQDNGTVATVCIVFAVAALVYLLLKAALKP